MASYIYREFNTDANALSKEALKMEICSLSMKYFVEGSLFYEETLKLF